MRVVLLALVAVCTVVFAQYQPNWQSLDARPLPAWFDQSKLGVFIHWGVFSVPSFGCHGGGASGEWYWWMLDGAKDPCYIDFHNSTYGPNFQYQDFAPMFRAELWDPDQWAQMFADAGFKYVVLTSKHHEGWTNWPSPQSWNWNSVNAGPHRDLLGDLAKAVRKAGLKMGCYHSLFEWFNPLYLADKAAGFKTSVYVDEILIPELKELITNYQCDVIWADGDWEAPDTYWKSTEFLAWAYNTAPNRDTFVTNDRWGAGDSLKHGGYYSGGDRFNPGVLLSHKWEDAFTIDKTSWGFNRAAVLTDYLTPQEIIANLVTAVACNGNALINIGPGHDGVIYPIFQQRLAQLGAWMRTNGDAIYNSRPWRAQNDTSDVWYTSGGGGHVYAIALQWAHEGKFVLHEPRAGGLMSATVLGYAGSGVVTVSQSGGVTTVTVPEDALETLQYAYVIRLSNVQ